MSVTETGVPGLPIPDGVERVGSKLLFENDRVRVWELRLEPGQREALHEHKLDYVMVQIDGDKVAGEFDLTLANDNAPGQMVLSGDSEKVGEARKALRAEGAKAIRLPVAGAFHSPLMEPAVPGYREILEATEFTPVEGVDRADLVKAAALASLSDPTPEGSSVVALAAQLGYIHEGDLAGEVVPFTAQTRMSGVDFADGSQVRKGAASMVIAWAEESGRVPSSILSDLDAKVLRISEAGGTPLAVATKSAAGEATVLGVIYLKDIVKDGLTERFADMRRMGIRTVMITGDNPVTAKAIAAEAGVDDFLAEATPEDKLALIRKEQHGGHLVAMTGDGTNDAPALAQADVGVAMNTGTSAAKEAGNMVDLDSDPTKLIDIVRIGKQLLITRGSLTTFSIANDVAKYFAIIPAMFAGVFPGLAALNVMQLHSPASAVLSAIVFNALVIVFLIPLALRGVRYRARPAASILSRNLLVYGIGGIVAPFIGIKLIDLVVSLIPGF